MRGAGVRSPMANGRGAPVFASDQYQSKPTQSAQNREDSGSLELLP
jgi:hypothetical protein